MDFGGLAKVTYEEFIGFKEESQPRMAKRKDQRNKQARRLHESTRRFMVQCAFLLLGLFPLGGILVWSMLQYMPPYQAWVASRWESQLRSNLGYQVDILRVENLSPNRTRLYDTRFRDPENKVTIATASYLEIISLGDRNEILARGVQLEGPRLPAAWHYLHHSFLCLPDRKELPTTIQLEDLEFRHEGQPQRIHGIVKVQPNQNSTSVGLELVLDAAEVSNPDPIQVDIDRVHAPGSQLTEIRVRSGKRTPLPCYLAQLMCPQTRCLGDSAELMGALRITIDSDSWSLGNVLQDNESLPLELRNVDFGRLSWNAPEIVSGLGCIRLDDFEVHMGALERLKGALRIDEGEVQREFLQAAVPALGLQLRDDLQEATPGAEGFGSLVLLFEVNVAEQHLKLHGGLSPEGLLFNNRKGEAMAACRQWYAPLAMERIQGIWSVDRRLGGAHTSLVDGVATQKHFRPLELTARRWLAPKQTPFVERTALVPALSGTGR